MLTLLFIAAACIEYGIKGLFRWHTWRDKGIIFLLSSCIFIGFLFTDKADAAAQYMRYILFFPGSAFILPLFFFMVGLIGTCPPFFVIFIEITFPYSTPDLSLLVSLPVILGNLPYTIFLSITMPPFPWKTSRSETS